MIDALTVLNQKLFLLSISAKCQFKIFLNCFASMVLLMLKLTDLECLKHVKQLSLYFQSTSSLIFMVSFCPKIFDKATKNGL